MRADFDEMLVRYAEAAVKGGLNLQPGQRLIVTGPRVTGGVSLEAAPLVRALVASAYRAGSPLVEVWWGDEEVARTRIREAPGDGLQQFPAWMPGALKEHLEAGNALLSVTANDPDFLAGLPPERVSAAQQTAARALHPVSDLVGRNASNWLIVAAPSARWADKVFPDAPAAERVARLWDAIFTMCRLDGPNAAAGWQAHLDGLVRRAGFLNDRRYTALRYRGPGTELEIGLPDGHVWVSGQSKTPRGFAFAPNMPTEEVFTMPHRERVNGVVRASKPLSYAGVTIEDFSVRFEAGRIVEVKAARGEEVLRTMVASDEGAARLGELALVPHSSPISRSGILFYNTLFDENASCHLAVGSAYRFTVKGGETMSDEEFLAAGGNRSMIHVDFMIGDATLDLDGVRADGNAEPLMRKGEWATAV